MIFRAEKKILGGHNVPTDDIYRRHQRSLKNFWETKKLVDKWELYHNVEGRFEKVAFGNEKEGVLNHKAFQFFKELSQCGL